MVSRMDLGPEVVGISWGDVGMCREGLRGKKEGERDEGKGRLWILDSGSYMHACVVPKTWL